MALEILVIHGPNLNLLGKREKNFYGDSTLEEINRELEKLSTSLDTKIEFFQSNHEGEIIDKIQQTNAKGLLINPAALTHTSVAIRDTLLAAQKPFIEVHLSNPFAREDFRRHSYFADLAIGIICGLGKEGYLYGLKELHKYLTRRNS